MKVDRKELKAQAKAAMRQAKPSPYWVVLLLTVITAVLTVLGMSLNGTLEAYRAMYAAALEGQAVVVEPRAAGGVLGWILQLALEVMSAELTVGLAVYTLRVWRREKAGCGDLFDGFGVFFRSIWIQLLPSLFVTLWSLLYVMPVTALIVMTGQSWWMVAGLPLLIPAVAASYSYRQAVYIMLDNPGMNCFQCVALSRAVMQGRRWELFVLDLSFLGWVFLSVVLPLVGLLLAVWVSAYMHISMAGYYEKVMGEFMALHAPPMEPPAA